MAGVIIGQEEIERKGAELDSFFSSHLPGSVRPARAEHASVAETEDGPCAACGRCSHHASTCPRRSTRSTHRLRIHHYRTDRGPPAREVCRMTIGTSSPAPGAARAMRPPTEGLFFFTTTHPALWALGVGVRGNSWQCPVGNVI